MDARKRGICLRALNQVPWLAIAGRWRASHSADVWHRARRANKTEDMIVDVSSPPQGTFLGSHQSHRPLPCCLFPRLLCLLPAALLRVFDPFRHFPKLTSSASSHISLFFLFFFLFFFFFCEITSRVLIFVSLNRNLNYEDGVGFISLLWRYKFISALHHQT